MLGLTFDQGRVTGNANTALLAVQMCQSKLQVGAKCAENLRQYDMPARLEATGKPSKRYC